MKKSVLMLSWLLLYTIPSFSSKIVEVNPLTAKILMIRFKDGNAIHHQRGQARTNESVTVVPLDEVRASLMASYTLVSGEDPAYLVAINPQDIGRKSKPTSFGLMCQTWDNGCVNTDPDHAKEHWIYLFLPHAMQTGKSYTLSLDNLAEDSNTVNFTYNESNLHSEAVHVNNVGYSTDAPAKYGYLYHWLGDKGSLDLNSFAGKTFRIFNVNTQTDAFTGIIAFRKSKTNAETGQSSDTPDANFSAADVYECDFSAFNTPGTYKLVVDGMGSSFPFIIDADAYHEPFYWAMKGLYHNRSGIALTAPYTDFIRPAPHHVGLTPGFAGKLKYSSFRSCDLSTNDGADVDKAKIESATKGVLENTYGWYQDAGDWDGYYSHTHVPAYLLFLYEAGKEKFTDGQLDIPESDNGIADVLDEATWLLRYFKRAKDEIKSKGWGSGGIPGARVFGDLWGSDTKPGDVGQGSWEDVSRDWYVLGEDPWATYKYAALAAQLAYVLAEDELTDPQGVDWKKEAIDAYAWAKNNTKESDKAGIKDVRLYSSASLYRLTGATEFQTSFSEDLKSVPELDQGKSDQMFGLWMYLIAQNQSRNAGLLDKVKILVTGGSEKYLVSSAELRACRWGGEFYFPMLVGQGTTPMVTAGVYGYILNKNNGAGNRYYTYLHTTADYFLGTNPLNMTWISGVGERSPVGLFHLDYWYSDKADPNNILPVQPGIIPYGPWKVDDFGALGWRNPNWAFQDKSGAARIYPPAIDQWPGHERWFESRISPLPSEFTIHQNTVVAAFVYGFLKKGASRDIDDGIVTSVESIGNNGVHIFPNPANGVASIYSDEEIISYIELYNANGKKVFDSEFLNTNFYSLDLAPYSAGKYIVKVHIKNRKIVTRKLMIPG